jgi:hypothetical protein
MEERRRGRGRRALAWVGGQTRHDNSKKILFFVTSMRVMNVTFLVLLDIMLK